MQTAVPAGTAVFRGKWKRTDSRFAAFGGRWELRSPLSPHRNAPSGHSGVPHGLFYDQAILWLDLQNAHAPGSLRSPSDAAPKCFFKTSRCSARLIRQAETLELQPRSRPPSSHTMAFAPKRSTSRFAPLTLRYRTEMFFQNIPVFRSAYFPIPHRPTFGAPVFRSAYSASRNARAPAASRPSVGGGSFAPPCPPSPAALRIRDGQLQRLPLRGAGAQRLKGGCAMAMRSSAG